MIPQSAPDWNVLASDAGPLDALVSLLSAADGPADEEGTWPEGLWSLLVDHGATRWALPTDQGGPSVDRPSLVRRYAKVAEGSLTAAFILTQHDAAVRRLVAATGPGAATARRWIEKVASGTVFPTVGISQLTTSRRHGNRAMSAAESAGGFILNGAMPWVTAAERADLFVTGGVMDDGRQLLAAVPRDPPGPLRSAPRSTWPRLGASRTCEIVVRRGDPGPLEDVLVGPVGST